jgi:uncharacterized membrane protein YecN with MAPEG domain
MILTTTLCAAAAAAAINIWLSIRCGMVRTSEKISIGDGGNEKLIARMRAHANFVENTPFVLMLIAALELAHGGSTALTAVAGVYMLGRVAHGLGMDGGAFGTGRMVGTLITMLTLLGLGIWAIVTALA